MERIVLFFSSIFFPFYLTALSFCISVFYSDQIERDNFSIALAIYITLFTIKVFTDDITHFSSKDVDKTKIANDLKMSLLMTFSLSASLFFTPINILVSKILLALTFLIGNLWIFKNNGLLNSDKNKKEHLMWYIDNTISFALLSANCFIINKTMNIITISFLFILLFIDLINSKSIEKLINEEIN